MEDKVSIGTLVIFCYELGAKELSELLYTNDHGRLVGKLNEKYADYKVDFSINFRNQNVVSALSATIDRMRDKYDADGYYRALFDEDEYALVILDIVDTVSKFDAANFIKKTTQQLELDLCA